MLVKQEVSLTTNIYCYFPSHEQNFLELTIKFLRLEPNIFHINIKSTIRYGYEDIEWAVKVFYAHEFISSIPDEYTILTITNC